jgi:hypothetical protein
MYVVITTCAIVFGIIAALIAGLFFITNRGDE